MRGQLPKENLPSYLANVLSIAKIDGEVSQAESYVLRKIIHRVGGTQQDLISAGKLLASGSYTLRLADSAQERMDNLQDMVMVALSDGDASPQETAPIERIAAQMRYTQADINLAVRRAELELKKLKQVKAPRKPTPKTHRSPAPPPIPAKPSPPIPAKPPPPIPEAPREAVCKEPKPVPKDKILNHETPEEQSPSDREIQPLAPEPEPTVDAIEANPPAQATTVSSDLISSTIKHCMECRSASDNPTAYCFGLPEGPINPWGCRQSKMPWQADAIWLGWGHFRDDVTFVFDKKTIVARLAANLTDALNCPHLDTEYTETAFDCLPSRATIGERWNYRKADTADEDADALSVNQYIHGCTLSTHMSVSGVDPIETRDAEIIIRNAARKSKRTEKLKPIFD